MGLSLRFGRYSSVGWPWPLVHRPWPLLTVMTGAWLDSDWIDIPGGYRVWFVFGMEEWEIRIKPPLFHTRWTPQIRGKDCSISALYIPSQPDVVGGRASVLDPDWLETDRFPTNQDLTRLQRHLLRGRRFPGSRAKSILHNEERCIMGLPLPRRWEELQGF